MELLKKIKGVHLRIFGLASFALRKGKGKN